MSYLLITAGAALVVSASVNAAIIYIYRHSCQISSRDDLKAVQSSHNIPTPRLGGLGVFTGFSVALLIVAYMMGDLLPLYLLFSAIPIFFAGLLEDTGCHVTPSQRLAASFLSGALAVLVMKTWISDLGLTGFDLALAIAPAGILVTIVWSGGVCNAFNLIDGANGLSGFVAMSIAMALSFVAGQGGDDLPYYIALAIATSILGFLPFNWPKGRIFLGDAGAYTIGHILIWTSIMVNSRNPEINYTSLSLLFFWPVADTILAMWRRSQRRASMMHPDYLHVHQFVMRALQLRWKIKIAQANALTVVVLSPFFLAPILTGSFLVYKPYTALAAWLLYGGMFFYLYFLGIRWVRRQKWRKRP